jgi:hypothetical protein
LIEFNVSPAAAAGELHRSAFHLGAVMRAIAGALLILAGSICFAATLIKQGITIHASSKDLYLLLWFAAFHGLFGLLVLLFGRVMRAIAGALLMVAASIWLAAALIVDEYSHLYVLGICAGGLLGLSGLIMLVWGFSKLQQERTHDNVNPDARPDRGGSG